MRTVNLHVGQTKTGSSYLQSVLLNGAETLAENGIFYPSPKNESHARAFEVNSGNRRTHQIMRSFDKLVDDHPDKDLLFSSEFLYREEFYDRKLFRFLVDKGVRIRVLVFIRNPMDKLVSTYQQAMKRANFNGTIDDFVKAEGFDWRDHEKMVDYVAHCEAMGVDLTILDYTRHRDTLAGAIMRWLGMPDDTLEAPDVVVNRGLSFAEIEAMRVLRSVFGSRSTFRTSDRVVNSIRDLEAAVLYPSHDLFEALLAEFAEVTARFDDRFGERYCRYDFDPEAERAKFHAHRQPPQLTTDYLDSLTQILGRDAYIDGMTTAELARAFLQRLKDRVKGHKPG